MKYQQREQGDDRCSHPKCRRSLDIIYLAGATPLNPNYGIQLCDDHHQSFCEKLRSPELTDELDNVEAQPAAPRPISVKSFMEGMWS